MTSAPVILAPSGLLAADELLLSGFWPYDVSRMDGQRQLIFAPIQDAEKDLDPYTREELVKHSRHLYRNSPLFRGIVERMVTYVVGCGIYPVPASSDKDWNARAKRRWRQIARFPVVNNRWNWGAYQRAIFRARLTDGEAFTLKTFGLSGRNRLQALPTHRIKGGPDTAKEGIQYDRVGRPEKYFVTVDAEGAKQQGYDAAVIVHHAGATYLNQKRGEPIMASAINTARDVTEILNFEKLAVKDASSKTDIIKTKTGELPMEDLVRSRITRTGDRGTSGGSAMQRDAYYRQVFGPEAKVLRHGDEWSGYEPKRPGQAWQGFMDFLANTICLSCNMPPSVILPMKVGGADTRRDLAAAARSIEIWQDEIVAEFEQVYQYLLEPEVTDGGLAAGAPNDWWRARWMFPKIITVDAGRESDSDRKDVAMALMSREEFHGRFGDDAEDVEDVVITEAVRLKEKIAKSGLSIEEFGQILSLNPALLHPEPAAPNPPTPTDE